MDSIQNRITAFVKLGAFLSQFSHEKFEKASTKPGASNKLYRKLYIKMYKKCGERGTTNGGDRGKETVEIAVPFFVNALK